MKNNYILLLLILFLTFIGVNVYELLQLLAPYYSYTRTITLLILFAIGIYIHHLLFGKKTGESMDMYTSFIQVEKSVVHTLRKNIQTIGYFSFIVFILGVVLSIFFNFENIFIFWVWGYFIVFIILKFFGFAPQFVPQKIEKLSKEGKKIFMLIVGIYAIFLGYLFQDYAIESNQKIWYYIIFLSLFILGAKFIFIKHSFEVRQLVRPYNLGMYSIIISLLIYMGWNSYKEVQFQKRIKDNPYYTRGEPGLMSDEAYLDFIGLRESGSSTGKVSDIYTLETGLSVGSQGEGVRKLKKVLQKLDYLTGETDDVFNEKTRLALKKLLIERCDWPESTKGIFGPLSKECVDEQILMVKNRVEYIQRDEKIISNEVLLENNTSHIIP